LLALIAVRSTLILHGECCGITFLGVVQNSG